MSKSFSIIETHNNTTRHECSHVHLPVLRTTHCLASILVLSAFYGPLEFVCNGPILCIHTGANSFTGQKTPCVYLALRERLYYFTSKVHSDIRSAIAVKPVFQLRPPAVQVVAMEDVLIAQLPKFKFEQPIVPLLRYTRATILEHKGILNITHTWMSEVTRTLCHKAIDICSSNSAIDRSTHAGKLPNYGYFRRSPADRSARD